MSPVPIVRLPSALAAGIKSLLSSLGMIADRAGWLTPNRPFWTATRAYITQTFSSSAHACAASSRATTKMPLVVMMTTFRRSWASTMEPPYSPSTTSGTRANRPTRPTENVEPVMS